MNIHIRPMTAADLPAGLRLKEFAGWNQTESDWRRFLRLQPDGCFVAELAGHGVGTATVFVFGEVAWIAMVLVDPAHRRQGVGTALMTHALEFLGEHTIRLDATSLGQPVYAKLGFVGEYELARYEGVLTSTNVTLETPTSLTSLLALDRQVTATSRGRLLELLAVEDGAHVRTVQLGGNVTGYLMDRPGSRAIQIGPAIALNDSDGRALFQDAARRLAGKPVFLDIPVANKPAIAWAEAARLKQQRTFLRMRRGPAIADQPQNIWASSGPEKG